MCQVDNAEALLFRGPCGFPRPVIKQAKTSLHIRLLVLKTIVRLIKKQAATNQMGLAGQKNPVNRGYQHFLAERFASKTS